jgi:hypothetical protein
MDDELVHGRRHHRRGARLSLAAIHRLRRTAVRHSDANHRPGKRHTRCPAPDRTLAGRNSGENDAAEH